MNKQYNTIVKLFADHIAKMESESTSFAAVGTIAKNYVAHCLTAQRNYFNEIRTATNQTLKKLAEFDPRGICDTLNQVGKQVEGLCSNKLEEIDRRMPQVEEIKEAARQTCDERRKVIERVNEFQIGLFPGFNNLVNSQKRYDDLTGSLSTINKRIRNNGGDSKFGIGQTKKQHKMLNKSVELSREQKITHNDLLIGVQTVNNHLNLYYEQLSTEIEDYYSHDALFLAKIESSLRDLFLIDGFPELLPRIFKKSGGSSGQFMEANLGEQLIFTAIGGGVTKAGLISDKDTFVELNNVIMKWKSIQRQNEAHQEDVKRKTFNKLATSVLAYIALTVDLNNTGLEEFQNLEDCIQYSQEVYSVYSSTEQVFTVKVIYDYKPDQNSPNMMAIRKGEILEITERIDPNKWIYAKNRDEVFGYVPGGYLKLI